MDLHIYSGFTVDQGGLMRPSDITALKSPLLGHLRPAWMAVGQMSHRPSVSNAALLSAVSPNNPRDILRDSVYHSPFPGCLSAHIFASNRYSI